MSLRVGRGASAALLLLAGLVAGLLLSEVAYRALRRVICVGGEYGTAAQARSWGWTHQPNAAGWAYGCYQRRYEYRTYLTINSHGLREREIPYAKPPGVRRVLLLGDSTTEAVQVPPERTFARLVEHGLQASGEPVEVINAGHAGFATDNELLFYRDEGRRYAPDVVVLVFNLENDILENSQTLLQRAYERADARWPPKAFFTIAADGSLLEHPAPEGAVRAVVDRSLWGGLTRTFFLLRSFDRATHAAASAEPQSLLQPLNYQAYVAWDETWRDAWAVTARLTRELRTMVEHDGRSFVVALLPSKAMIGPETFAATLRAFGEDPARYDLERAHRVAVEFLRADGIPFVDLEPALHTQAARGEPPFFVWDVHLTAAGHAAVAPVLVDDLRGRLDAR